MDYRIFKIILNIFLEYFCANLGPQRIFLIFANKFCFGKVLVAEWKPGVLDVPFCFFMWNKSIWKIHIDFSFLLECDFNCLHSWTEETSSVQLFHLLGTQPSGRCRVCGCSFPEKQCGSGRNHIRLAAPTVRDSSLIHWNWPLECHTWLDLGHETAFAISHFFRSFGSRKYRMLSNGGTQI